MKCAAGLVVKKEKDRNYAKLKKPMTERTERCHYTHRKT